MSLRRTGLPVSPQPAENPAEYSFKLTLFETPPLPISLSREISCWWQERRAERQPEAETPLPLLDMRPWFRNLPEQIRALLAAAKAAPAAFSSRPVDVPDIWQDYLPNPYSWANSLLVHALVLTALVLPFAVKAWIEPVPLPARPFDITRLTLTLPPLHGHDVKTGGGGGGGQGVPLPPSIGALPRFARVQFTPPMVVIPRSAALPMQATLIGPPALILPAMKLDMPFGDPSGVAGPPSPGPGNNGGIGTGTGTGVGAGNGPGAGPGSNGGYGGGPLSVGIDGVTNPVATYSPEPAYSEEARRAKFGGRVLLWIVVDAQGMVQDIRIAKHLGMGLDEEAVKTVRTWKFRPATRQGVPVPVQVEVEVSFRLF
jgi:periplasmic protein TonB